MSQSAHIVLRSRKVKDSHVQQDYFYDQLTAQRLLCFVSLLIPIGLLLIYIATPHASDGGSGFVLVAISLSVIMVAFFRLLMNWKTPRNSRFQLMGAGLDFFAISLILIGYSLTYDVPISVALKSPTANMFFIYLASRVVLFNTRIITGTGIMAAAFWMGLVGLSLYEPQSVGRTGSYIEYLTSFKVLLGAEVERILQFGIITAILYAFVRFAHRDPSTGLLRRMFFLKKVSKHLSSPAMKDSDKVHGFIEIRSMEISTMDKANSMMFALVPSLSALRYLKVNAIGRLSSQSIGIWIEYPKDRERLGEIAHDVLTQASKQYVLESGSEILSLVAGGCYLDQSLTSEDHFFRTEIAIKEALKAGENMRIFDDEIHNKLANDTKIIEQIRTGFKSDLFDVFYQPIVDMMTNKPVGFEALVRLRGEDGKMIPPSHFIPVAEDKGLVSDIMDYVCAAVAKDAAKLSQLYADIKTKPYININVAPSQMRNMPRVIKALKCAQFGGLTINVEMTESSMFVGGSVESHIQDFKDAGFKVAIDDFGTGYSSIQRLNKSAFNTLKIDQSFVQNIHSSKDYDFLAAIFKLAQTGAENVIIEGIETLEQKLLVMKLGIRYAQGYFFCRPMDLNGLMAYLSPAVPSTTDVDSAPLRNAI